MIDLSIILSILIRAHEMLKMVRLGHNMEFVFGVSIFFNFKDIIGIIYIYVGKNWLMNHQCTSNTQKKAQVGQIVYFICVYYARIYFSVNLNPCMHDEEICDMFIQMAEYSCCDRMYVIIIFYVKGSTCRMPYINTER